MTSVSRALALLLMAGSLGGFPAVLSAQQPAEVVPAPRFEIKSFEVTGNTLLPEADVERLVAPFKGADTLFPYTTLFRSIGRASCRERV